MTWCEDNFQRFNDAIKLNLERRARIDSAIERLWNFCQSDEELSAVNSAVIFHQGSVRTGSVVRPLAGDEFDVDLVFPFKLAGFQRGTTSQQVMNWFEGRFAANDFYSPRLIRKDRCVRIDYAGDFHLDVTAATEDVANCRPWAIATRDFSEWEVSDPVGFADWVAGKDANSRYRDTDGYGRFVRCIRYMKRWRDSFFSTEVAPTSILLVTAMGKHDPVVKNYNPPLDNALYPQYQTDAAYLYDMLRLTHSCILAGRGSAFWHPTLSEDLGRQWADKYLGHFLEELQFCISRLGEAIYEKSDATSIQKYKAALGDSFPG